MPDDPTQPTNEANFYTRLSRAVDDFNLQVQQLGLGNFILQGEISVRVMIQDRKVVHYEFAPLIKKRVSTSKQTTA